MYIKVKVVWFGIWSVVVSLFWFCRNNVDSITLWRICL